MEVETAATTLTAAESDLRRVHLESPARTEMALPVVAAAVKSPAAMEN